MFRFTIRELILLTVIVAMGAAWWVKRQSAQRLQNERNDIHWKIESITSILRDRGMEVSDNGRTIAVRRGPTFRESEKSDIVSRPVP
jgi:hypothetical protein